MKKILGSALFSFFVFCVFIPSGTAQTVKAGYVSRDLNYLPFFVAQKMGFYAAEGIQVDLVFMGRADIQLQALFAGAVLGIPFGDIAIDRGFNKLGDTTEVISVYQFNVVNVNPVWAEEDFLVCNAVDAGVGKPIRLSAEGALALG